jgi:hypothetical protein
MAGGWRRLENRFGGTLRRGEVLGIWQRYYSSGIDPRRAGIFSTEVLKSLWKSPSRTA